MNEVLRGGRYVITGGSSGFGLALARALVAAGSRVTLLGRRESALETVVEELGVEYSDYFVCDVGDSKSVHSAFASIGPIEGLINNAGMAKPGSVEDLDEAEVEQQVRTNFLGTVFCCQAAIPLLRAGVNPRIVNISSASAWHYDEMSHLSVYASTKAAVERFTRDLREEVQSYGIGVTCLRPGAAWTNFADGWDQQKVQRGFDAWRKTGPEMDAGMEASHVASAVIHVLSYPQGVAVDLMEIRPNTPIPKPDSQAGQTGRLA
ncbi:MAG: SDR family oxidoreductase [Haliea sp.]|jgi:NAD(P)-dependent dehydrogenase (short-subunit alcohol dehydrogenase family)|nr:SDR family oxidoreductase [Haliea sp.]